MDEWTDSVRIAVDLLVACVIIAALLTCMMLGGKISNFMDLNHAAAADAQEYRVANQYEGADLYVQDIVNLALTFNGDESIEFRRGNSYTGPLYSSYTHTSRPGNTDAVLVALEAAYPKSIYPEGYMDKVYHCKVETSSDGTKTFRFY